MARRGAPGKVPALARRAPRVYPRREMTAPDIDQLKLTELIALQDRVAQTLRRRFERPLACAFTDVVGSTEYFARFGDHAGRLLHQRHLEILKTCLGPGRIVDTAGDGAFSIFPKAEHAAAGLAALQNAIDADNRPRPREHHLSVRAGFHWGPVLTDGTIVTGESVNLCARVCASASGGEIRLTRPAFLELPPEMRRRAQALQPIKAKGFADPVDVLALPWRAKSEVPTKLKIVETEREVDLPARDTITFGRLAEPGNAASNDIPLVHPDPALAQKISRWHFELRRSPDGLKLRAVTDAPTEVDGVLVPRGTEVPVKTGTTIKVSRILTVTLEGGEVDVDLSKLTTPT
jgi:class 3 adenylate cyclase